MSLRKPLHLLCWITFSPYPKCPLSLSSLLACDLGECWYRLSRPCVLHGFTVSWPIYQFSTYRSVCAVTILTTVVNASETFASRETGRRFVFGAKGPFQGCARHYIAALHRSCLNKLPLQKALLFLTASSYQRRLLLESSFSEPFVGASLSGSLSPASLLTPCWRVAPKGVLHQLSINLM